MAYTAPMDAIVDERADELELAALARRYGVARLEFFGSAASGHFEPGGDTTIGEYRFR